MTTLPFGRLALAAALVAGSLAAHAQTTTVVAKAAPVAKKASPKAKADPKIIAAPEVLEPVSEGQMMVAQRVLTGTAQCEFNQTVNIAPLDTQPGYFKVSFNKASYTMAPMETTTGAVRLEDKKNGVVWLQIPTKSMMMNHKIGQRIVDACTQVEQRAAADALASASPR